MPQVRELPAGETVLAARALLELRPQYGDVAALAARVDDVQRAEGYRVLGSFDEGAAEASGAAGFRVVESLHWGRGLYVDDLGTLPEGRGRGPAHAHPAEYQPHHQRRPLADPLDHRPHRKNWTRLLPTPK